MTTKSNIIEFYGDGCAHCVSMMPVVREFESKHNLEIKKLEVWNDAKNQEIFEEWIPKIEEITGGFAVVPTFVNTITGKILAGSQSLEQLEDLL